MSKIQRIVVFTGDIQNFSVRKGLLDIDQAIPNLCWLIVVNSPNISLSQLIRNQYRNLRHHGWRRVPDIVSAVYDRITTSQPQEPSENAPGVDYDLTYIKSNKRFKVLYFNHLHSAESISAVSDFSADIGLSLAAPILKNGIFDLPKLGTLNLHKGKVPDYKGMPPAFWEMWNDETSIGCTLHWVDKTLDTGPISNASSIAVEKFSTVKGLQLGLDDLGNRLLLDTMIDISKGTISKVPQTPGGNTYRKPSLKQVSQLKKKIENKLPDSVSYIKGLIKDSYKKLFIRAKLLKLRFFAQSQVTVLMYHRVTDEVRDNLTVGVEQFDRQMDLLRKNFKVISLPDLLSMEELPISNVPIVCITFDDGYLDNYTNATPILIRHQLSATFFVTTGLIGTSGRFPHDVRRGNSQIPLLSWDQIGNMHSSGFTIGSHTVNHVNCAETDTAILREELSLSMQELKSRLKLDEVIFAYPYGGTQHMTPEKLELVKQAGYVGCVSAYGGVNIDSVDNYNVLRRGIHWEFSDTSFIYSALGL